MVTKIVNPVLNLLSPAIDGALFAADVDMGGNVIEGLPLTPTANDHAASKFYVDQVAATAGGGVFLPAGFGPIPWSGTVVPVGWLLCDGASYATATYPDLFGAIGYTYGGGGASFNVPDMRGIVPGGMDDMTPFGSAAGPGGNVTDAQADTLGGLFGSETHTLTLGELASHGHTGSADAGGSHTHTGSTDDPGDHTHTVPFSGNNNVGDSGTNSPFIGGSTGTSASGAHTHTLTINPDGTHGHTLTINSNGGGGAHNNVQPTRFFGYIIKSTDATLAFPGDILMSGNRITGLPTPTAFNEAATKGYVDSQIAANATYDVALFVGGFITLVGKEVARFPVVRGFTISSGFGNSQASCRIAPTGGSAVFELRKQGSGIFGTITFGIGSTTGSFAVVGSIPSFGVGDVLRVTAATADPSQEDIGITIEALL